MTSRFDSISPLSGYLGISAEDPRMLRIAVTKGYANIRREEMTDPKKETKRLPKII